MQLDKNVIDFVYGVAGKQSHETCELVVGRSMQEGEYGLLVIPVWSGDNDDPEIELETVCPVQLKFKGHV